MRSEVGSEDRDITNTASTVVKIVVKTRHSVALTTVSFARISLTP